MSAMSLVPDSVRLRQRVLEELGEPSMIDAAGIVANFQRMVRIADASGMDSHACGPQTQVLDHRQEVVIGEQQWQPLVNAERTDDHIDSLAYGNSRFA